MGKANNLFFATLLLLFCTSLGSNAQENLQDEEEQAFIYRPEKGAMWDPSVIFYKGYYHAFMMFNTKDGTDVFGGSQNCLVASSKDGVHWHTDKVVIEELEKDSGVLLYKPMVAKCGNKFILNYGLSKNGNQDKLRFFESKDLYNWDYLFTSSPDSLWYGITPQPARWDHMYMIPKVEGKSSEGYWGYVVAYSKPGAPPGVGMMESKDGHTWTVLPPAPIEFPKGFPIVECFEWGGCERIGDKYYLIGGTREHLGYRGYMMFTLVADNPRGPFRIDPKSYRLCGSSGESLTWLAVWCRGDGELLISNYSSMSPWDLYPYLLPLRKPIVDKEGILRLGWWKGNEAIKGRTLTLNKRTITLTNDGKQDIYNLVYLDEKFDPPQGIVIEGTLTAHKKKGGNPSAGFVFKENANDAMVTLIGIGNPQHCETRIGRLTLDEKTVQFNVLDFSGKGSAMLTGIEDNKEHHFILLSRLELFELYIDGLLVQTFFYKQGEGRIGFVVHNASAVFSNLEAWQMEK